MTDHEDDFEVRMPIDMDLAQCSAGDRQQIEAFAAFLRHAGPVGKGKVPVNAEWHAWLTGKGPTPDPTTPVGPTDG